MKPLIGIVARPHKDSDNCCSLGIADSYRRAITLSGGNVICILPSQPIIYEDNAPRYTPRMTDTEKEMLIRQTSLCDGVLMPGGSKWYEYDELICKYCIENNIPILGICMGEQIMSNVNINNTITSGDKTVKNDTNINHYQPCTNYVHSVTIDENSKLYSIIKRNKIMVNSRHNYHVEAKDSFKVVAMGDDGIIEAIEFSNKTFAIGLQWHPESLIEFDENSKNIFNAFIESAKK